MSETETETVSETETETVSETETETETETESVRHRDRVLDGVSSALRSGLAPDRERLLPTNCVVMSLSR